MKDETRPVRLHCFAHAGAGISSYRAWGAALGPGAEPVPVQLPGRDSLRALPRLTDRDALVRQLLPALLDASEAGPYALYGHSLGGLVAYTLARALQESGARPPVLVAVGACLPPDRTSALLEAAEVTDAELFSLLADLGSAPSGAAAVPGGLWYRSVLPVLRDDLRLALDLRAATRGTPADGRLEAPVLAIGGDRDTLVGPEGVRAWRSWTTGEFTARFVAGDHFFVRGAEAPRLVGEACRARQAVV
jgi:surfactin synthase thioesterase subunit